MTTVEFLAHLRSLDIQVSLDGERLRCNAPEGVLTSQLRAEIAQRKSELIDLLHQVDQFNSTTQIVRVPRDRLAPFIRSAAIVVSRSVSSWESFLQYPFLSSPHRSA